MRAWARLDAWIFSLPAPIAPLVFIGVTVLFAGAIVATGFAVIWLVAGPFSDDPSCVPGTSVAVIESADAWVFRAAAAARLAQRAQDE